VVNGLLGGRLRYRGDAFVTTSEDKGEHVLEFSHETVLECLSNLVLRTPCLCL
jgi:hypothetical protein